VRYEGIRMCDGKNHLEAGNGHGSFILILRYAFHHGNGDTPWESVVFASQDSVAYNRCLKFSWPRFSFPRHADWWKIKQKEIFEVKIFMTGGTGFVGNALAEALVEKGFSVTILTRHASAQKKGHEGTFVVEGDPRKRGKWQELLLDQDVVINLAGASIFQRWNDRQKQIIRESRVLTTQQIVKILSLNPEKKIDLINASAVGYYGYHGDEIIDEGVPSGTDFLASVCREWEAVALNAKTPGSRVVLCRFGVVLGRQGGALQKLLPLFQWGLGARLGTGKQWFSWIHERDLVRIIIYLLENRDREGPVNCTSPEPVRNEDLTRCLGKALKRPIVMPPVPGFVLRIALGGFSMTLLKGQRVIPKALKDDGFFFKYPELAGALQDIVSG